MLCFALVVIFASLFIISHFKIGEQYYDKVVLGGLAIFVAVPLIYNLIKAVFSFIISLIQLFFFGIGKLLLIPFLLISWWVSSLGFLVHDSQLLFNQIQFMTESTATIGIISKIDSHKQLMINYNVMNSLGDTLPQTVKLKSSLPYKHYIPYIEIPLRFNKSHVNQVQLSSLSEMWFIPTLQFASSLLFFILLSVIHWNLYIRPARWIYHQIKLRDCFEVQQIICTKIINYGDSYRLIGILHNQVEGRAYHFKSPKVLKDPIENLNQPIMVHINPNNYRYYQIQVDQYEPKKYFYELLLDKFKLNKRQELN